VQPVRGAGAKGGDCMKRKPAAFTPAARAVCSEFLALLQLLAKSDDPEKVKPLGAPVLLRLEKIANGGKVYLYSDNQICRMLDGLFGDAPPRGAVLAMPGGAGERRREEGQAPR
jgi:hypothetical protein